MIVHARLSEARFLGNLRRLRLPRLLDSGNDFCPGGQASLDVSHTSYVGAGMVGMCSHYFVRDLVLELAHARL